MDQKNPPPKKTKQKVPRKPKTEIGKSKSATDPDNRLKTLAPHSDFIGVSPPPFSAMPSTYAATLNMP